MTAAAQLFRRRAALTIAVPIGKSLTQFGAAIVEITDLRFQFKIKKTLSKEPNTSEITVTNLSEQSRAELQNKKLRVSLSAGYENTLAVIFTGDSRDCDSVQDDADWTTKIQCGDGERAYRFGRTSESFRRGVRVTDVLQKIADGMGLDSSTVTGVEGLRGRQYVGGYAAHGRSARELERILRGFGYAWSIQDGQLQILAPEASTADAIIELSFSSGLIGSPTLNTPSTASGTVTTGTIDPFTGKIRSSGGRSTLKARSLLQPEIRPGRRVQLDSTTGIKGVFRVTSVTHTGDTHGGDWFSDFEGVPV